MLERVRYAEDLEEDGTGGGRHLLQRLVRLVLRNPGRAIAAILIVGGMGAVAVNAAFFQTGEHPSPLFATRPADEPAAAANIPTPRPVTAAIAGNADEVGRLVELTRAEPPQAPARAASPSVVEAQRLLAAQGYEPGLVDGLFGTRTRGAIEAYERDHGLAVTGVVNEDLLAQLRRTATDPTATAAPPTGESALILAVQTALNQTGFGPLVADGELTEATRDAIRGFQLHYGLALTGRVDDALVDRMVAIGALDSL